MPLLLLFNQLEVIYSSVCLPGSVYLSISILSIRNVLSALVITYSSFLTQLNPHLLWSLSCIPPTSGRIPSPPQPFVPRPYFYCDILVAWLYLHICVPHWTSSSLRAGFIAFLSSYFWEFSAELSAQYTLDGWMGPRRHGETSTLRSRQGRFILCKHHEQPERLSCC